MKLLNVAWLMLFFVNFESCHLVVTKPSNSEKLFSVTLVVYSGRPDPTWMISATTNPTLFNEIQNALIKRHGLDPSTMPEKLGYRGFLVSAENDKKDYLIFGHTTKELQKELLDSIPPGTISPKLQKIVFESILSVKSVTITHSNKVTKRRAPSYDESTLTFWNNDVVRQRNNCYNYATNIPTFTYAQPGTGTGQMFAHTTEVDVWNAARRDGLTAYDHTVHAVPVLYATENHPTRHLVALFVAAGIDFHWYRLDRNGLWSHKIGPNGATNRDNDGHLIIDPRNANTAFYQFVAFMFVDKNSVRIL